MDGAWSCKRLCETSWERRNLSLKEAHEPGSSHAEDGKFPGVNYNGLSVCLYPTPPPPPHPLYFVWLAFLFPHLTAVNCALTRTHDCLYLPAGENICLCFHNLYLHCQKREFVILRSRSTDVWWCIENVMRSESRCALELRYVQCIVIAHARVMNEELQ
jgi:hypothetical protein